MAHVLITFLGRRDPNPTTFKIDGLGTEGGRLAGMAVLRLLARVSGAKPDRVVVLGTSGSCWGRLLAEAGPDAVPAAERLSLTRLAQDEAVTESALARYQEPLCRALDVERCDLRVVGQARDEAGQGEIVEVIGSRVAPGDRLTVDVTHSLRHLPMLALLASLQLETLEGVEIGGFYYGAYELEENGVTPVLDLKGLVRAARWIEALHSFDADGDYGVFAELLLADGAEESAVKHLKAAAHAEWIQRLDRATTSIISFRQWLDDDANRSPRSLKGFSLLFEDRLRHRLGWIDRQSGFERQRELAWQALHNDDPFRAAIFGIEAFVTKLTEDMLKEEGKDLCDQEVFSSQRRFQARAAYEDACDKIINEGNRQEIGAKEGNITLYLDYLDLTFIRNAFVHGSYQQGMDRDKPKRNLSEQLIAKGSPAIHERIAELSGSAISELLPEESRTMSRICQALKRLLGEASDAR